MSNVKSVAGFTRFTALSTDSPWGMRRAAVNHEELQKMLKTLDLLIGIVVVYLMLSFVLAAVREAIEARLKTRARHLAYGLMQLLNSKETTQNLYNHPLIAALYAPSAKMVQKRGESTEAYGIRTDEVPLPPADFSGFNAIGALGRFLIALVRKPPEASLPSYIPARTFALGLVGMALEQAAQTKFDANDAPVPQAVKQTTVTLEALRTAVDSLSANGVHYAQSLQLLINGGVENFESAVNAIENWYDGTMDRVSGWYRRESAVILFWLGLATAVALNVDSVFLVKYLSTHDKALQTLVDVAGETVKDKDIQQRVTELRIQRALPTAAAASSPGQLAPAAIQAIRAADERVVDTANRMAELGLPIGWSMAKARELFRPLDDSLPIGNILMALVGWFITAVALSLGAPFWFDVLNKIMVIRSTVKPTEKSKDEGQEDRQAETVIRVEAAR